MKSSSLQACIGHQDTNHSSFFFSQKAVTHRMKRGSFKFTPVSKLSAEKATMNSSSFVPYLVPASSGNSLMFMIGFLCSAKCDNFYRPNDMMIMKRKPEAHAPRYVYFVLRPSMLNEGTGSPNISTSFKKANVPLIFNLCDKIKLFLNQVDRN